MMKIINFHINSLDVHRDPIVEFAVLTPSLIKWNLGDDEMLFPEHDYIHYISSFVSYDDVNKYVLYFRKL